MTRTEFFETLNSGAKWDIGVAINRTNPVPIDANEVFDSTSSLESYLKTNPVAYPGQIVTVISETEVTAYVVQSTGAEGASYTKLAATTASGDVTADITKLYAEVDALKTRMTAVENSIKAGIQYEIVEQLPETGTAGKIYLIADATGAQDAYDEFLWVEVEGIGNFEKIGNTAVSLDDYYTKSETDSAIDSKVKTVEDQLAGKQAANDNLTALSGVKGIGLIKRGSDGSMSVDTNAYLTASSLDGYAQTTVTDALDGRITANEEAIAAINNEESGILAQAKAYTNENSYNDTTIKADIAKNTSDIATNKTAIEKNATDIATANTAITKNANDIASANATITTNAETAKSYTDSQVKALNTTISGVSASATANASAIETINETIANKSADWAKDTTYTFGIVNNNLVITPSEGKAETLDLVTDAELATTLEPYAKTEDVNAGLAKKQDVVTFNTEYNATTNKAATMKDLTDAMAGLGNAMHFVGAKESVPETYDGAAGDVIIVGNKEYVYDGTKFIELGDETIYAVKGSITNSDIAANAAIEKSKLSASVQTSLDKADSAEAAIATAKSEAISAAAADATTKADTAKSEAIAHADGLAKNYATADQGAKADTALQEITTGEGLTVTQTETSVKIEFDTLILNGGSATEE